MFVPYLWHPCSKLMFCLVHPSLENMCTISNIYLCTFQQKRWGSSPLKILQSSKYLNTNRHNKKIMKIWILCIFINSVLSSYLFQPFDREEIISQINSRLEPIIAETILQITHPMVRKDSFYPWWVFTHEQIFVHKRKFHSLHSIIPSVIMYSVF